MKKFIRFIVEAKEDFLSLIFPRTCYCCDSVLVKQEVVLCSKCNLGIPRTFFHLVEGNPVEQVFWGRINIQKASSYFLYQKGSNYQKLIHHLKYKNAPQIGFELGKKYASELAQNDYLADIDIAMPVPLHKRKQKRRGYNQSLEIAKGITFNNGLALRDDILYRTHFSETQTRKGRFERWENMKELFETKNAGSIENKHILLVDDIVTTGATIEACVNALQKIEGVKVSVISLAFTSN